MTCRCQLHNLYRCDEAPCECWFCWNLTEKHIISTRQWTHITLVPSHISPAGGAIAAGFVFAVIHLAFAIASSVVSRTFTIVSIPSVDTVTTMVAKLICLEAWLERFVRNILIIQLHHKHRQRVQMSLRTEHKNTSLASSCFTGDPRDVTVTSRPAISTITDEGSILLPTASSILAGRWASAPVNWSLGRQEVENLSAFLNLRLKALTRPFKSVFECVCTWQRLPV